MLVSEASSQSLSDGTSFGLGTYPPLDTMGCPNCLGHPLTQAETEKAEPPSKESSAPPVTTSICPSERSTAFPLPNGVSAMKLGDPLEMGVPNL